MKFTEFNLHPDLLKGIEKAGFTDCMPVQEASLEYTISGRDVFVQSQTGSGKTAAFLIAMFQKMLTEPEKKIRGLIIAPTRELALQIEKEGVLLSHFLKVKLGVFYGGVGYHAQEKLLKDGVDVIIGTPGRIIDLTGTGKMNLKDIGIFVIDEADRMFDMGFYPDIKRILSKIPPKEERQTMLFSATLDEKVRQLADKHMNNPAEVEIAPEQVTVDKIEQFLYHVGTSEKMSLLLGILKKENPKTAIIFTNTKHIAVEVSSRLEKNGYNCEFIMGDLPQKKRTAVIDGIKSGKIHYLVATDVAARGLHIDDLELVINYDIPENYENYVHRIGRTARAGKSGKAIALACEKYVYALEPIESYIKMKIPVEWPTDDMFVEDQSRGMDFRHKRKPERKDHSRSDRTGKKPAEKRPEERRIPRKHAVSGQKDIHKKTEPHKKPASEQKKYHPAEKRTEKKSPQIDKKKFNRMSLEDRVKYYNEKYGESFKASENDIIKEKKKSLISRIISKILKR